MPDISSERATITVDGNEAAAIVAHRTNEVIAIYPITPASPMGEHADLWSTLQRQNVWGSVPEVVEMQAEGGAAGAVHGALQAGSLTTTFTASQGLLLMIPNMYKIAGELTPTVFHIAARSVAAQALSIFGDHSDVMAARATGWAMLFSSSVQEVMDFALIAQAATLETRVPFLHVMDGFRTSHEIQKIERLSDADMLSMLDEKAIRAHRMRAMSPDRPFIRGTAQNPDVFFQARESVNPFYDTTPEAVETVMNRFAERTGRQYGLFDYVGAPDAERVLVLLGSGCETAEETVTYLAERGEKVGAVKVRLFRPFSVRHFLDALPTTARVIAVLDRTKEPGSAGEPLYQDVLTAIGESFSPYAASDGQEDGDRRPPLVIGGRYGLSSKEFTPAMIKGIFEEMTKPRPKNHFTVGIYDDVTHTSLDWDPDFDIEPDDVTRAVFWGLGSDGTVGANKNSIKIIGEETDRFAQGYFVYDSRKAGARTISHLRFGPKPIHSTYLIRKAGFVAVHQFGFLERYDTLEPAAEGATLLLNCPYPVEDMWQHVPERVRQQIVDRKLTVYAIDAYDVASEVGLGIRINTIMQTCFFALSGVLPKGEAIEKIKEAIRKSYGKRGEAVVRRNFAAVDATLERLHRVEAPGTEAPDVEAPGMEAPAGLVPDDAPDFVRNVTGEIIAGRGDLLPVSALPVDGTYPSGTTRFEKRNLALEIPVWDPDICIQCGKCVMVCPHAVIRAKVVGEDRLGDAPEGFLTADAQWRELEGEQYTLQVAVEDCTACRLCVEICPVKDKSRVDRKAINMEPQLPLREQGRVHWDYFLDLPDTSQNGSPLKFTKTKDVQLLEPLFEFSGACAGCGETPYLSLMTRLFGDRAIVANATGCSSIYGGNLPTTPWAKNKQGRGPAWNNSLFEDNAEFGLGMRLAVDKQASYARELVDRLRDAIGDELASALLEADQSTAGGIAAQRERVERLKEIVGNAGSAGEEPTSAVRGDVDGQQSGTLSGDLAGGPAGSPALRDLAGLADLLVEKSVWIVGGDGWAYDIGYGGLDHVLAGGRNVNVLVLDTEVYSNTGGQASKATALGAVAKFAAGGKKTPKKDLGLLAMSYGYVYVAQIAMGADDNQAIKAFREAESYDGPSIIIAYSQCIAHGIDMAKGMEQSDLAVRSGYWPLYRFDPRRADQGKNPLQLDSKPPMVRFKEYAYNENRYRMLEQLDPDAAADFMERAQVHVDARWTKYEAMARPLDMGGDGAGRGEAGPKMPPKPGGAAPPAAGKPEKAPGAASTNKPKIEKPKKEKPKKGPTLPPGY